MSYGAVRLSTARTPGWRYQLRSAARIRCSWSATVVVGDDESECSVVRTDGVMLIRSAASGFLLPVHRARQWSGGSSRIDARWRLLRRSSRTT